MDDLISPDNAAPSPAYVYEEDGLFSYVHNPTPSVQCYEACWRLGAISGEPADILEPLSPKPQGTYALCRANRLYVEVLGDYTASRTIWYYHDEELFAASTSQRLIISLLGDFRPNRDAHAWMLSSGTLGPGCSWDQRLAVAMPDATLQLDRKTFQLGIAGSSLSFTPVSRPAAEHERLLREAVADAVSSLNIKYDQWALALSGGMDSRSILYHLPDSTEVLAVTWGLDKSLSNARSDAVIARRVAGRKHLKHAYFRTDGGNCPFSVTLNRFLQAGEGRIDHLSGYNDGLELWSKLSSLRRDVIRGYDALGSKWPVAADNEARFLSGFTVATDYDNEPIPADLALRTENIPLPLRRQPNEMLDDYRDRLWLEFRTSFVTAALDDIKAAYVEICNPLLVKGVVDVVRTLPQELRTHKVLFGKIVGEMFPSIGFAKYESTESVEDIVATPEARAYLSERLLYARESGVLPANFLSYLALSQAKRAQGYPWKRRLIARVAANLPEFVKRYPLLKHMRKKIDIGRLALRAVIIIDMNRMLVRDAQVTRPF
jgi:hypothetical protein